MDMKKRLYVRVEATGVKERFEAEGIYPILARDIGHWLNAAAVRSQGGAMSIMIQMRDAPFGAAEEDENTRYMRELLTADGRINEIHVMTPEEEAAIKANRPPWADDRDWEMFFYYMASHKNYETAGPTEIRRLQDSLRAKYGGMTHKTLDGDTLRFDDLIIDRRI